jgi:AraC-type DNA-binding domain-containing proteins
MEIAQKEKGYIPYQPGFEQRIHYHNYVVPKEHPLYGIVSDFYQFDSNLLQDTVCVIPDGCIDLLFRYDKNGVTKTIEGYHRTIMTIPVNQVGRVFGVRFTPGGFTDIVDTDTSELIGKQLPLYHFMKKNDVLEQMEAISDFEEQMNLITDYLMKQKLSDNITSEIVRYCNERIIRSQGNVQIGALSKETGYSIRYLRNLFHYYVGVSPKELCEIIRFQFSFLMLSRMKKENQMISLSDFAIQAGYYDQSHMNKCYRNLVGCVPQKFYQQLKQ